MRESFWDAPSIIENPTPQVNPKSLDLYVTGCVLLNGRLGDMEKLQASIATEAPKHGAKLIFQTTSSEKLYVLHRTVLEKAVQGDLGKIKQLLRKDVMFARRG